MSNVKERIEKILTDHKIVLFMKGEPSMPQCGFSARAAAILAELKAPYHAVNVLEDSEIREGIKEYGSWPTIPQLYINKDLLGGSDILTEMYQSGELKDAINKI